MPEVDRRDRLDNFLRRSGLTGIHYQQYRIEVLLRCGAIKVYRGGALVAPLAVDTIVDTNDLVELPTPLSDQWPTPCKQVLNGYKDDDFRTYAYSVIDPKDPILPKVAKLLDRRDGIVRLDDSSIDSLTAFVRELSASRKIDRPIRDLMLASHAFTAGGELGIRLNSTAAGYTSYEDLIAIKGKSGQENTLRLDKEYLLPRPHKAPIPRLRLINCDLGEDRYFSLLQALRDALGGMLQVTAPRYGYKIAYGTRSGDLIEYLAYEFRIFRPHKILTRDILVRSFTEQRRLTPDRFRLINNTVVQDAQWNQWIERSHVRNPSAGTPPKGQCTFDHEARWTIPVRLAYRDQRGARLIGERPLPAAALRYVRRCFYGQRQTIPARIELRTEEARKALVREFLVESGDRTLSYDPKAFRDDHPFPVYRRFGYDSMDEFIDGWDWQFQAKSGTLSFFPVRYEYWLEQPIFNPDTRRLFGNFFPAQGEPLLELPENELRLFADTGVVITEWRPPRFEAAATEAPEGEDKGPTRLPATKGYRRESNLPPALVGIAEVVLYRLFRVVAFDIGSANLDRPGIKQGLDAIIRYLGEVDDAEPRVTIIGLASESRLKGEGGFAYGWKRAKALEKYFRDHSIPGRMIGTVTSHGSILAPPADSPPEAKAWWRTATIEITLSGKPKPGPPYRGGYPPHPPLPQKRSLLSPIALTPEGLMGKAAKEIVIGLPKELKYANTAGAIDMCRQIYYGSFAEALADLSEADPTKRHVDEYRSLPRADLYELCGVIVRTPVSQNPQAFAQLTDLLKSTAKHNAVDWVASMGQSGYNTWAQYFRQEYPDHDARRRALREAFLEGKIP